MQELMAEIREKRAEESRQARRQAATDAAAAATRADQERKRRAERTILATQVQGELSEAIRMIKSSRVPTNTEILKPRHYKGHMGAPGGFKTPKRIRGWLMNTANREGHGYDQDSSRSFTYPEEATMMLGKDGQIYVSGFWKGTSRLEPTTVEAFVDGDVDGFDVDRLREGIAALMITAQDHVSKR